MSKGEVNGVITKKEIAESQLKEAYSGLKAIKAQKEASLKEIDAKIAEAQGLQNSAGVMINNGKIYSNISGIITMKMAEIGQVINAGMPIYKVVDTSKLKVKTSVSNDIYKNLKIGQKINLAVEGYNKKITGKISSLNKEANKFTKKIGYRNYNK
ncbi:MAG: HlyD family secretion protein [Candidatus Gracilibacteria bacterium]|nr:HlyD family secretion protein [Candidatus Gracilibacteria bacterium]